jgi:hypothetical protein
MIDSGAGASRLRLNPCRRAAQSLRRSVYVRPQACIYAYRPGGRLLPANRKSIIEMDTKTVHDTFEKLAVDERFDELPIAFHIEPHRDLSTHEIAVDARRALHLIAALAEFASRHGLKSHTANGQVVMSPGRGT